MLDLLRQVSSFLFDLHRPSDRTSCSPPLPPAVISPLRFIPQFPFSPSLSPPSQRRQAFRTWETETCQLSGKTLRRHPLTVPIKRWRSKVASCKGVGGGEKGSIEAGKVRRYQMSSQLPFPHGCDVTRSGVLQH